MLKRRTPIDINQKTTVIYPSSLFSLEKDEIFPYERFAYNFLDMAIEALHAKNLIECVYVEFANDPTRCSPWTINASVRIDLDGSNEPTAFHFGTPEIVPALLYLFCAEFVHDLSVGTMNSPEKVRTRIQNFGKYASAGVQEYNERGFAAAIRAIYEHAGLTFLDLQRLVDCFDVLTKQVALHEVGHAYIKQISRSTPSSSSERRAFELVADLIATEWLYNKLVRNTPDDDDYREYRGLETYAECIFQNTLLAQRSQLALLVMFALAGAQWNQGVVTLSSGQSHPGGLQRHSLQVVHFYTLVHSNCSSILSVEQLETIKRDWDYHLDLLIQSGAIPFEDLAESIDDGAFDNAEAAAALIEEMNISELKKIVPVLREFRELVQ